MRPAHSPAHRIHFVVFFSLFSFWFSSFSCAAHTAHATLRNVANEIRVGGGVMTDDLLLVQFIFDGEQRLIKVRDREMAHRAEAIANAEQRAPPDMATKNGMSFGNYLM